MTALGRRRRGSRVVVTGVPAARRRGCRTGAGGREQRIVVVVLRLKAAHDGFDAGRLVDRDAADVDVVHQLAEAPDARGRRQGRSVCATTSKVTWSPTCVKRAPSKSKPTALFGHLLRIGEPDEARLGVDEAAHQPRGREAVDPGALARRPGPALERLLGQALQLDGAAAGLAREESPLDLAAQRRRRRGRRPPAPCRGRSRSQRSADHCWSSERSSLRSAGSSRAFSAGAGVLQRSCEVGVLLAAVEQLAKRLFLRRVARLKHEQVRVDAAVLDVALDRPTGRRAVPACAGRM